MKRSSYIYLFAFFIAALGVYQYYHPTVSSPYYSKDKPHLNICRKVPKVRGASFQPLSLNYRGSSLVSNSTDPEDLVLCPGDAFGDLNGTYIVLHDCYLAMYDQGELIWSSKRGSDGAGVCATSLQKDGNLVLYKESMTCFGNSQHPVIWDVWDSRTDYHPNKTEMRIQDQQLQVIHTLQDGTQRLFFTGENIREFQEDMRAPRQVAEKFLLKNHNGTNDSVILRRNEYIGDLNTLHLILQTNCELQLKNSNNTIWSFAAYLKPDERCALSTQENSIGIPKLPMNDYRFEGMNILPPNEFIVLQSNITLSGDQLLITQALKNGSEITFYNEPGQDNGLKLKRELTQIANNSNITISSKMILERLDYIGDLDGLHLILRDNCVLTLANGRQEFWKLQESLDGPFMECNVQFNEYGTIMFNRFKNNDERGGEVQIFGKQWYYRSDLPSEFQLSLENNAMILTLQYLNKATEIYHANVNTNGTWFQALSNNSSFTVNANDTNDKVFPGMGYIGDINGVYAVLNRIGNWILSNRSQVIWESGTTEKYNELILTRDGNLALSYEWATKDKDSYLWSTQNITTMNSVKQAPLSTAELLVNNDGLWLIHYYTDGTVSKFKAQEGTKNFALVPNENEVEVSPPSQIYKL